MNLSENRDTGEFLSSIKEFVSEILQSDELEIKRLKGDASTRRYYRVYNENNSVIIMRLPPDPLKSEELCSSQSFDFNELPFVNVARFLKSNNIRVPEIYTDKTRDGFLIIEDLGDEILGEHLKNMPDDKALENYKAAISIIKKIQGLTENLKNSDCYAGKRSFDEELLYGELMHFVEYGMGAKTGKEVADGDMDFIDRQFRKISKDLAAIDPVLCLRDFQSRNIMLKNGEMVIIDFQDALMGSPVYDLVSLTRDSYIDISHLLPQLLEFAYKELDIETKSFESFERMYHLQTIQRKLKDAGRFVYIDRVKGNDSFLRFIPQSLEYVKQAFAQLKEYEDLRKTLAKYRPELKNE